MDYSITIRNTKNIEYYILILRKVQYTHYHVLGIIQYYVDIASRNLWILIMSRFYAALEIFPKFPKKRIWCFVWVPFKVLRSSVLRASGYRKDTLCSHIHTEKKNIYRVSQKKVPMFERLYNSGKNGTTIKSKVSFKIYM